LDTFATIEDDLLKLEQRWFTNLKARFIPHKTLEETITGGVQFAAVDGNGSDLEGSMPVICSIGINYTQNDSAKTNPFNGLYSYLENSSGPRVRDNLTGSRKAVVAILSSYNRNENAWTQPTKDNPKGSYAPPDGLFANRGATIDSGLIASDLKLNIPFILIMTNFCPLITKLYWSDLIKKYPSVATALLHEYGSGSYLDDLFNQLGSSVDLWIGHSATSGVDSGRQPEGSVWPRFKTFVTHHGIRRWLLSPNISGSTYNLHVGPKGQFRKRTSWLAPLFAE
jgi:hypothetical protein